MNWNQLMQNDLTPFPLGKRDPPEEIILAQGSEKESLRRKNHRKEVFIQEKDYFTLYSQRINTLGFS